MQIPQLFFRKKGFFQNVCWNQDPIKDQTLHLVVMSHHSL